MREFRKNKFKKLLKIGKKEVLENLNLKMK